MKKNYAPICLFVFKKIQELEECISALKNNYLAPESDLIIYSDGPTSNPSDAIAVARVRNFIHKIEGFKSVKIIESEKNLGLSKSIISGVNEQLHKYGKIIVLEDDVITSSNFLNFMNAALDYFDTDPKVLSISGFSYNLSSMKKNSFDNGFSCRMYPWGWATWLHQWKNIDFSNSSCEICLGDKKLLKEITKSGSDLQKMMNDSLNGKIDSWMIKFIAHQAIHHKFDVFPKISKTANIGFGLDITHNASSRIRYKTNLDVSGVVSFEFNPLTSIDPLIAAELKAKHSFGRRFFYRLIKLIFNL